MGARRGPGDDPLPLMGNDLPEQLEAEVSGHLDLLLVHCVVRLEDSNNACSLAALRCLQQLVFVMLRDASKAEQAAELLRRREQEPLDFEAFIFPFVFLIHRELDAALVVKRLEICRTYLSVAPGGGTAVGGESMGVDAMPTCVATGLVAA